MIEDNAICTSILLKLQYLMWKLRKKKLEQYIGKRNYKNNSKTKEHHFPHKVPRSQLQNQN